MTLSEKTRAKMYTYFTTTPLGEEATNEMIPSFAAPELKDLVTKDHLDARIMEVRLELHTEISGLRNELTGEINGLPRDDQRVRRSPRRDARAVALDDRHHGHALRHARWAHRRAALIARRQSAAGFPSSRPTFLGWWRSRSPDLELPMRSAQGLLPPARRRRPRHRCARSRSRPSRMIHFFDPSNEKMAAKVPDIVAHGRRPARQPRGRRPGRPTRRRPAPAWSKIAQDDRLRRHPAVDPRQQPRLARGRLDDLTTLVTEIGDKLDVIMVPKVEGAEDIHYVDRLLAQLEAKAGLDRADPRPRHPRDGPRRGQRRGDLRAPARACRASRSARPTSPPTAA